MTDVLDPPIDADGGADGDASSPDAALIAVLARVAERDESAFAELYDATCAAAFGWAVRMTGDRALAEIVVGDVYRRVWEDAGERAVTGLTVRSWIVELTRRSALARLRAHPAVVKADVPEAQGGPVQLSPGRGPLSPQHERAVSLALFGGHSQSEIAERTGESLGAVKTRMREALTLLRAHPLA